MSLTSGRASFAIRTIDSRTAPMSLHRMWRMISVAEWRGSRWNCSPGAVCCAGWRRGVTLSMTTQRDQHSSWKDGSSSVIAGILMHGLDCFKRQRIPN